MTDPISSVEEIVTDGDMVTTVTTTKTVNADQTVTTTTTVDQTNHADEDNHITSISESTSALSDLDQKIIRQIEYYFSDVNLMRDKFLQTEMLKDDRWIPLSTLITFKRLQSLTTDFPTIMSALQKSPSGLLELNTSENKLRRHPNRALPQSQAELEAALKMRTVFVKGFPVTADVTLDRLLSFFEKYGATDNIQMKKQFKSKDFGGSAFVVFPTEDKAREFVEKSKDGGVQYDGGSVLECSLIDEHSTEKPTWGDEKQAKREKKQQELQQKTNEHFQKLSNENITGAVIHLAGMAPDASRELIKEKFNPFTKLPWIDFNRGDAEAWVRLNEPNTARDVLEKVLAAGNGKLVIGSQEVTSRVVEGEEEARFWKDANEKRAAQRTNNNERHGSKRKGRGKRGRSDGRKRRRSEDDHPSSNGLTSPKKTKNEPVV